MEIGVWGDSITYGAGDINGLGWVGLLRNYFYEKDYGVYNRGICGDTTEEVLKRFDMEVESIEPDIIILAIGINDSKVPEGSNSNRVPLEHFQDNVNKLTKKAKSNAKKVIIIGLTEVNEEELKSTSKFENEVIHIYDNYLQGVSKREGLEYVDLKGVLDAARDLEDGLHPNSQGYRKMFERIMPFISL